MKPWISNLIFAISEICIISLSFIFFHDALESMFERDFTGYLNAMTNATNYVRFVDLALLILSIIFLIIKPLRTKFTCFFSICNILYFLASECLIFFI